jgi:hypothetical protein
MSTSTRAHLVCLFACFLLAGCDQSINELRGSETPLSGLYCDAKGAPEQNCKAGDIIATVKGRERLLCDWGWQIVHEPGSDEIVCVYHGQLRENR